MNWINDWSKKTGAMEMSKLSDLEDARARGVTEGFEKFQSKLEAQAAEIETLRSDNTAHFLKINELQKELDEANRYASLAGGVAANSESRIAELEADRDRLKAEADEFYELKRDLLKSNQEYLLCLDIAQSERDRLRFELESTEKVYRMNREFVDGAKSQLKEAGASIRALQSKCEIYEKALQRLTKIGPPSRPTTGLEYAQVALEDNCKIAEQALLDAKTTTGEK